jgi:MoaA/NifB/PqqE/SkfB family radical SAM enzyme
VLTTTTLVALSELTNRTFVLPLAVFFPTSRCNSRCVSCDWWKSSGDTDLTLGEIGGVAGELAKLGTRVVLFSGGEPLLRPDVFDAAQVFRRHGITLHLHTSGVLLDRLAPKVVEHFGRVIVSLDSSDEKGYRAVRGVAALRTVEHGVARVRELAPRLPITARSTVHKLNFRELTNLVEHAKAMSVDQISFLAADVSSSAFGRSSPGGNRHLALDRAEIVELADIVERTIASCESDFASGFIAETPAKLRRLPQYYAALAGLAPFPPVQCNAPHVSVVIEADGTVRPCFFHEAIGSVRTSTLTGIVRENLRAFRATVPVPDHPICERCVCAMKVRPRSAQWP